MTFPSGTTYAPNIQYPSTVNSHTGTGTSQTGSFELVTLPWAQITGYSDVAGTVTITLSNDGTNTHSSFTRSVSAGGSLFAPIQMGYRYIKVDWSSASSPSSLSILTTYGFYGPGVSALNAPVPLDAGATLVRSTLPWLDVKRGLATGITAIKKFGRNAAVGTSFVPITFSGNYNTPQSGSATTLRIKAGGDANDTAAGSGARELTLEGLDENFALATETLVTAGASASSATTTTFTRLFRAYVSKSGTYATASAGSHVGDITIENGAGGTDWAIIDSADFPKSQSEIGAYSVPSGKTAYVFLDDITIDSGKTVDIVFFQRANIDETAAPYTAMRATSVLTGLTGGSTDLSGRQIPLGPFVGPCDIGWLGKVDATTGSIGVEFEIFLVDE